MAFGTLSSRVLGLVREMAFAALFDRAVTDAWIAAFRLPNLFRRLLGEGSLSVSFVPVFVEARLQDPGANGGEGVRAANLANGFFTLLLGFLTVLTVLGILFPEPILQMVLGPPYVAQTEKFELTVRLARIMFGFVFLISLYAYFMGILNALGIYGLPAMAPTLFNVAMIVSTLLPPAWFPSPGDGLAWGVIAGGFLQMAILVPALAKRGYLPKLAWPFGNKDIRHVLRNMVPGLIGLGLIQVTTIVNMRFASELGEGPISWIAWADRLLELPLSLVSVSLGTALLPTLSGLWSQKRAREMSDTMNFLLRLNLFLCVGAAAGLYALSGPIIELLFERGRFTAVDTAATAGVLQIWALIMVPTACVRVLAPSYYAIKNTWFPALVSVICLVVHIVLAPLLMARWGLTGLNSSSLLSSSLNFVLLLSFYGWLVTGFAYGRVFLAFLKFLVPAAVMVAGLQLYWPLRAALGDSLFAKVFSLVGAVVVGGFVYALVSRLLGLEEWHGTAERLLAKVRRRLKL
ncbi:MAG: murein biosynthesis integral membrane protein MurJ [Bdellovibrionaceae bacterium]|nr:murein biosynthesis integral membrane protein MurJ [Pseudobdellovibrionaceae bacterium]